MPGPGEKITCLRSGQDGGGASRLVNPVLELVIRVLAFVSRLRGVRPVLAADLASSEPGN